MDASGLTGNVTSHHYCDPAGQEAGCPNVPPMLPARESTLRVLCWGPLLMETGKWGLSRPCRVPLNDYLRVMVRVFVFVVWSFLLFGLFGCFFLLFAWGACSFFCCLGGGLGPRPNSKKKNTPPPKQQKKKHAPAPSERVFFFFCCLGGWVCLLFGREACSFFCCLGGVHFFLLFGPGTCFFFCCLGRVCVCFFAVWAEACFFFCCLGRGRVFFCCLGG